MKKLLFISTLCFLLYSCSSSKIEHQVVNDFLKYELQNARYHGINKDIILIKEAGNKNAPLIAYEQLYNKTNKSENPSWILNSSEIKKYKLKNNNDETLFWKQSDLYSLPITLISTETNASNYKSEKYINDSEKLIITLSKPLKLSRSQYLVYYYGRSSIWGGIDRQFVVEMVKRNHTWVPNNFYLIENFYP